METNWCKGLMNYLKECPGIRLSQTPLYNLSQSSVKVFSKEKSSFVQSDRHIYLPRGPYIYLNSSENGTFCNDYIKCINLVYIKVLATGVVAIFLPCGHSSLVLYIETRRNTLQ